MIDTFGWKLTMIFALGTVFYLLVALAPLILPAVRAFRRHRKLDRPWLFTGTIAALTYGAVYLIVAAVAIPVEAFVVFIAPSLQEAGKPHGAWLAATASFVGTWWWPVLPLAVVAVAALLTRRLAPRWAAICSALD